MKSRSPIINSFYPIILWKKIFSKTYQLWNRLYVVIKSKHDGRRNCKWSHTPVREVLKVNGWGRGAIFFATFHIQRTMWSNYTYITKKYRKRIFEYVRIRKSSHVLVRDALPWPVDLTCDLQVDLSLTKKRNRKKNGTNEGVAFQLVWGRSRKQKRESAWPHKMKILLSSLSPSCSNWESDAEHERTHIPKPRSRMRKKTKLLVIFFIFLQTFPRKKNDDGFGKEVRTATASG